MQFNSIEFAVFIPFVFALYWFACRGSINLQNFLIVISSYFFYACWDFRFLALIILSTLVDFIVGIQLGKQQEDKYRKLLLFTSLFINLGILATFKYYDFFLENLYALFEALKINYTPRYLNVILPVGISFYTFQTLSYTVDIYRKKLVPTKNLLEFSAFVCFFPQLVAGPIERATHLLPQFHTRRVFNYEKAADGLRQILWGLFKKIVIADNCAEIVNSVYNNSADHSGSSLFIATVFFSLQIYCDFSGYSDIAIGLARLFGFDLKKNFNFPYFSRDIAEFWRRWHISLTTWFRDYVYIPLGGSRKGKLNSLRNVFIIFIVSGFWHGANWTFICWGLLNALLFTPVLLLNRNRKNLGGISTKSHLPSALELFQMISTYILVTFTWIFFRSENISQSFEIFSKIFSSSFFLPIIVISKKIVVLIIIFISLEWIGRKGEYGIHFVALHQSLIVRWSSYLLLILAIYFFGNNSNSIEFIYFQF